MDNTKQIVERFDRARNLADKAWTLLREAYDMSSTEDQWRDTEKAYQAAQDLTEMLERMVDRHQ